ncbi:glycine--tRNA ligase [Candidatus Pacearchaeota archaeon]|nr:glycine--tRNA ligase [Candidatus Pacearchaeota archaeon]
MAFIVKKKIRGKDYYYLNENKRIGGKVKTKTLAYLGKNKKDAEKKAKEIAKIKIDETKKTSEKMESTKISIDEMAVFCKRKGFAYPSGEIYGGLSGFWDFGPLGVELKNNIKREWWKYHVYSRKDMTGIDGSIITNPSVWKASGHVDNFSDVFVVCKKCKKPGKVDRNELGKAKCLNCGGDFDVSTVKDFNLMFKTNVGEGGEAYLRPETAQLIFADFKLVHENARMKLPFGIAQFGKAFRNEIAPRDFLFRSREFEQMEIEYFIKPDSKCDYEIPDEELLVYSAEAQEKNFDSEKMKIKDALKKGIIKKDWHAYWLAMEFKFFKMLGANPENFRIRQHKKDELAHYSSDCWDLEYKFPFGWKELEGIADRKDYDLSRHEKFSGKDLKIFDEETKEKFLPHVVCEPSIGVERAFLVFLFDSYFYDEKRQNVVLRISPKLAPIKAAVFPIVKKEEFEKIAVDVFENLSREWKILYDESGSIGRRYARNDEAGTPYCITVDGDSAKNRDVTIRERNTTKQIRVKIADINEVVRRLVGGEIEFEKAGKSFK